ncbi:hypothetical protein T12_6710, partial [Trichinella patagoniensis]
LYNWFSQRRESQYVRQSDHNRVTLITVAITVNQNQTKC